MRKRTFISFAAGFLCCLLAAGTGLGVSAGEQSIRVSQDVKIEVEGEPFAPRDANGKELPIFVYEGSTYAPVRALGEKTGCRISYDPQERTVEVRTSPKPEYYVQEALKEDLEKRMALVRGIRLRDAEGRAVDVDVYGDQEDTASAWFKRLYVYNHYYKVEDGTVPGDYEGSGIDVMFLDEDGDCLYKYQNITENYAIINGELYTNDQHGGGDLDLDRIRRVLEGKPEEFEPEKLFQIEDAEWLILRGYGQKEVRVDGEALAQLTEEVNSLEYRRGEPYAGWAGCPQYNVTWYNSQGRRIGWLSTNAGGEGILAPRFRYEVVGGAIDTDRYERLVKELPEAERWDTNPIWTFSGALNTESVTIENGLGTYQVMVTDPELVKRLAENVGTIDFRVQGHVQGSAWDRADDGRCFLYWSSEWTVCARDEKTVAFSGDNGYLATAMDGKTIDMELINALLDQDGPYAGHPGVSYRDLPPE
ncbi:hypothetical protein AALA61_07565 [Oscillospiraceae bacterium 42-9]